MANSWFRMYHEFATDPKVQMLSEVDQRRYIMLLCLKCANGDVTLQETEVAFQLRISNEELTETLTELIRKGLINEAFQPTAWDKRQFISDSSAARVSRHREKKKRYCNVTETKSNALDTDTDTDTDTEKNKNTRRFAPPSREEVQAQIVEMGYQFTDAQDFINFYGSKNWMVGKNKMSDWRKALGGWESRKKSDSQRYSGDSYSPGLKSRLGGAL